MGLADMVAASKPQPKPQPKQDPVAEIDFEHELSGEVTADGIIKLDTTNLDVIGARLRAVRQLAAKCKKEDERLKKLILAHPDSKPGYKNSAIEIEGSQQMMTDNPELLVALMQTNNFAAACNMSVSQPKVRALAETEPKIADALRYSTVRKVKQRK